MRLRAAEVHRASRHRVPVLRNQSINDQRFVHAVRLRPLVLLLHVAVLAGPGSAQRAAVSAFPEASKETVQKDRIRHYYSAVLFDPQLFDFNASSGRSACGRLVRVFSDSLDSAASTLERLAAVHRHVVHADCERKRGGVDAVCR